MRLVNYRGKWAAEWREFGETRRASLRTTDRQVAEQELARLKKDQDDRHGATVNGVLDVYLRDKVGRPSHNVLTHHALHLRKKLGDLQPARVTRLICRKYIEERGREEYKGRPAKEATILKELSLLRAAIKWVSPNCGAVFELPSAPPPRDRHLTRAEYEKLRQAAEPSFHTWLFVVLALSTGARSTALLELTWDRVDLERGLIMLNDASQTRRKGRATVPMTATARDALEKAKQIAITNFVIEYAGKPLTSIKKSFQSAVVRAGLEDVSPHVLRHTAAVWMAEREVPLMQISQFLGHKDSRITERVYSRFSPSFLRGAASALE